MHIGELDTNWGGYASRVCHHDRVSAKMSITALASSLLPSPTPTHRPTLPRTHSTHLPIAFGPHQLLIPTEVYDRHSRLEAAAWSPLPWGPRGRNRRSLLFPLSLFFFLFSGGEGRVKLEGLQKNVGAHKWQSHRIIAHCRASPLSFVQESHQT